MLHVHHCSMAIINLMLSLWHLSAQPPQPGCPPASVSVANAGCHNTVLSLPLSTVIPVLLHMQATQLLLQHSVFVILGNVLLHPAIAAQPLLVFMLCHSCNAAMHYANGRLLITCCATVVFCRQCIPTVCSADCCVLPIVVFCRLCVLPTVSPTVVFCR